MKKALLFIAVMIKVVFSFAQTKTLSENFLKKVGDTVVVSGKIYGGAYLIHVKTKPTFLNLGDASPDHRLIIRIEPEDRDEFPAAPEIFFLNKIVSVTGKLQDYKGSPLIQISAPEMIKTGSQLRDTTSTLNDIVFEKNHTDPPTQKENNKGESLISKTLSAIKPDIILPSVWIKSVSEKAAEQANGNVRIVQKDIALRTAPYNDAPLLAQLHTGMVISVLYSVKKWSYINITSIDGFSSVSGFIKHKRFRHLRQI